MTDVVNCMPQPPVVEKEGSKQEEHRTNETGREERDGGVQKQKDKGDRVRTEERQGGGQIAWTDLFPKQICSLHLHSPKEMCSLVGIHSMPHATQ